MDKKDYKELTKNMLIQDIEREKLYINGKQLRVRELEDRLKELEES